MLILVFAVLLVMLRLPVSPHPTPTPKSVLHPPLLNSIPQNVPYLGSSSATFLLDSGNAKHHQETRIWSERGFRYVLPTPLLFSGLLF